MTAIRQPNTRPLATRGPSLGLRLFLILIVSILLMVLDHREGTLTSIRTTLSVALYPIRVLADLPVSIYNWMDESLTSRGRLLEENEELREEKLITEARLQRFAALEAENARLRALMGSSRKVADRIVVAEILSVDMTPYRHRIVVNKGDEDGAHSGQAILDADGIFGQITQADPFTSEVILISDASHALPVENNRNGLRTIAQGTGDDSGYLLNLPFLPNNADIEEGDLLVSSGLGGTFPAGYPVAVVTSVTRDPGEPFADVWARPTAALNRRREVLVVFAPEDQEMQTAGTRTDENGSDQ